MACLPTWLLTAAVLVNCRLSASTLVAFVAGNEILCDKWRLVCDGGIFSLEALAL